MWKGIKNLAAVFLFILAEACIVAGAGSYILWKSQGFDDAKNNMKEIASLIQNEMKRFPVARTYIDEVSYQDTYNVQRENGSHNGCDIMDLKNQAGRIPVISATDGVVSNLGWLYLGGYRIGITSESGIYYYYAHFDSFAANICVGKEIKAGELLGFMGNTGEGGEGTKGKFDVHLHFGIYVDINGDEETVNPYSYLTRVE